MKANPTYYEGKPKIDKLIFAITPDAHVRFQKLKGNECQFIAEPSPQDIMNLKQDKNLTIMQAPGLNVGYIAFNVKKKPLIICLYGCH
ncbi:MAG: ABC transporter substrate-binding protein [Bacteriovoracaceae bacterium]